MSTNRPRNTPKSPQRRDRPPARQQGGVRVNPTRPQNAPPSGAGTPPLAVMIGGGLLVLLAVIFLGTIFLNNTTKPAPATVPTVSGSTGSTGSVGSAGSTAVVETPKGTFKIHLFTDDPAVKGTIKNFVDKVNSGYFNGKIFHRVEDWVIQGGDPTGTGTGGGNMPGEYTAHPFITGTVGMASTASHAAQVNDSQWFVVKKDSQNLNNNYVIFGQVTDGMDVVNKIAIGDTMTKITIQP